MAINHDVPIQGVIETHHTSAGSFKIFKTQEDLAAERQQLPINRDIPTDTVSVVSRIVRPNSLLSRLQARQAQLENNARQAYIKNKKKGRAWNAEELRHQ